MITVPMYDEQERMRTFDKWRVSFINSHSLVRDGFYYTGCGDVVRCAFCHVEIGFWEQNDVPEEEHRRCSPKCPFVAILKNDDFIEEYAHIENRLRTFKNWPENKRQPPLDLAISGFYYVGVDDRTICFCCGIGLKDWQEKDDAFEEHLIWSPKCSHLQNCIDQYVAVYSY